MHEIADYLGITVQEFAKKYLRSVDDKYSLKENLPNYDCVFLKDQKFCSIYPVRPTQCRTYPFWPRKLISQETWEETASECEGIQDDAPVVPFELIQENLEKSENY